MILNNRFTSIFIGAILLSSCAGNSAKRQVQESESISGFEIREYAISDSISVGERNAEYSAKVDFPDDGSQALTDSIRAWIAMKIIGNENPDSVLILKEAMKGDIVKVLDSQCRAYLNERRSDFDDAPDGYSVSIDFSIKESFRDDNFVTFENVGYEYRGGAHGVPWLYGQTFYRDGRKLGWNLLKTDADTQLRLRALIVEALKQQYFKTDDWTETGVWMENDSSALPMPTALPYLIKDGITFVYAPYEIGPYVIGQPCCTIPLSRLAGLLNPEYFPGLN